MQDPDGYNLYRALLIHEYVHVLDYRAQGVGYLGSYASGMATAGRSGQGVGSAANPLEARNHQVETIYEANPWLPPPWDFPR